LGAQILNYGLFKYFQKKHLPVSFDLSYFDIQASKTVEGQLGCVSHWSWELDAYGVNFKSLRDNNKTNDGPCLRDGPLKTKYILQAFQSDSLKKYFNFINSDKLSEKFRKFNLKGESYLCIHARRGDYLNVGFHLVSENELEVIAEKFKKIFKQCILLSDTTVKNSEYKKLRKYYKNRFHILDREPDPKFAHSIMRNSSLLICSNSQFSLSASLLSNGVQLVPKKWFGRSHKKLNTTLQSIFDFGVVK
jgi:hypothetical protein